MRPHLVARLLFMLMLTHACFAANSPLPPVQNLDTPRDFPTITNLSDWQLRARQIREQILVSAGLWPMPEKTPLHAVIFGKIIRDGYSVEKVYFQSYPGFYVAGNLYRPLNAGRGPFPALLSPHGHWENGRLVDNPDCSIPGRCINFAKQGMIAFSYDMVGYNDTQFADTPTNTPFSQSHRSFAANNPIAQLWGISLMGLQTWNSIRALDFLESLPDVDPHRLACTGESGGGTQTFILGAVDDRLAAQAPVVMVSHTMQGGCACENMPGLRVQFSNMEIAAAAAPRPQILIGATGDWTTTMTNIEGPAVQHIYDLFNLSSNLRVVEFDFHHNYNQTSRQAVYQWFDKTLLNREDKPVKESAFQKEPDADLRVFPNGKPPADAVTQEQLIQNLINEHKTALRNFPLTNQASLTKYREVVGPAFEPTLQVGIEDIQTPIVVNFMVKKSDYTSECLALSGHSDTNVKLRHFIPVVESDSSRPTLVVLVDPRAEQMYLDSSGAPVGLARQLLDHHFDVALLENIASPIQRDELSIFYTTYNRTLLQERVRQLISYSFGINLNFRSDKNYQIVLWGTGQGAYWSLLAEYIARAVIADCGQLDVSNDQNLLTPGLFCPGIRNLDAFAGVPITEAPKPLLIHNTAGKFPVTGIRSAYQAKDASAKFKTESRQLSDNEIIAWISDLNR